MKTVLDFNPVLLNKHSGFYAYGLGLLKGFSQLTNKPEIILLHSPKCKKRSQDVAKKFSSFTSNNLIKFKLRWLENIWQHISFPSLQFFSGDFDIYHCIHHLMPPVKDKSKIMTVHDLRRYVLPDLYRHSKVKRFEFAVRNADHFITVSQSTKNDLCRIFEIPEEKVDVVHLAADVGLSVFSDSKKQYFKKQLSKEFDIELSNYFVTFSSPDKRKNITRTIKAFNSVKKDIPEDFKLVVIGSLPKNQPELTRDISKDIIILGPVEDVLPFLSCSQGLIFASLYEGFGIPILEAFSCGVPVITSNISSMPEVGGDAALLVDPYDINSISEEISNICTNQNLRNELSNKGLKRAEQFNWKKTAQKTLDVYKKLTIHLRNKA